jgi:hypothetical protein
MVAHNDGVHWDMNLFRLVHAWELDFASSLFNAMYSVRMGRGDEEKLCWNPLKRRSFEVKFFTKPCSPIFFFSISNVNSLIKRRGTQP